MTAPYTAAELAAISARAEAATPGPWAWRAGNRFDTNHVVDADGHSVCNDIEPAEAAFLAAARSDVPRLVAELTRAREDADRLRAVLVMYLVVRDEYSQYRPQQYYCSLCGVREPTPDKIQHIGDCPIAPRAALGEEPADGDTER